MGRVAVPEPASASPARLWRARTQPQAWCRRVGCCGDWARDLLCSCRSLCHLELCLRSWLTPLSNDASEADVACRGIDRLGVARGRTVPAAIVRGAQMRAAFEHLARNFD